MELVMFAAAVIVVLFMVHKRRSRVMLVLASISLAEILMVAVSTAFVIGYADTQEMPAFVWWALWELAVPMLFGVIAGLVAPKVWAKLPAKVREAM